MPNRLAEIHYEYSLHFERRGRNYIDRRLSEIALAVKSLRWSLLAKEAPTIAGLFMDFTKGHRMLYRTADPVVMKEYFSARKEFISARKEFISAWQEFYLVGEGEGNPRCLEPEESGRSEDWFAAAAAERRAARAGGDGSRERDFTAVGEESGDGVPDGRVE